MRREGGSQGSRALFQLSFLSCKALSEPISSLTLWMNALREKSCWNSSFNYLPKTWIQLAYLPPVGKNGILKQYYKVLLAIVFVSKVQWSMPTSGCTSKAASPKTQS